MHLDGCSKRSRRDHLRRIPPSAREPRLSNAKRHAPGSGTTVVSVSRRRGPAPLVLRKSCCWSWGSERLTTSRATTKSPPTAPLRPAAADPLSTKSGEVPSSDSKRTLPHRLRWLLDPHRSKWRRVWPEPYERSMQRDRRIVRIGEREHREQIRPVSPEIGGNAPEVYR